MSDAAFVAGGKAPRARSSGSIRFIRQTGFYLLYDGENDQVDPVGRVRRTRFQRVVPRYRLSASETNDTGLGPPFYELPVYTPPALERGARESSEVAATSDSRDPEPSRSEAQPLRGVAKTRRPPQEPWLGTYVDFYA